MSSASPGRRRPPPSLDDDEPEVTRVHADDAAGARCRDRKDDRRCREVNLGPLQQIRRTTERRDHLREAFRRRAAVQRRQQLHARRGRVGRDAAQHQHLGAQGQREFMGAGLARPASGQVVDGAAHFQRVADFLSQHLVHVGDQRPGAQARAAGHVDDALRELASEFRRGRERAVAALDVHRQALQAGRELLGQDARGDQRYALHRGRDVAHRVEALVGRRQIAGLADDGAAQRAHDAVEVGRRRRRRSRGWPRACRRSRPCARARVPRSSAHSRRRPPPSARSSGSACRRRRRSNACPAPGPACPASSARGRCSSWRASARPPRRAPCPAGTPPCRARPPGPRSSCRPPARARSA